MCSFMKHKQNRYQLSCVRAHGIAAAQQRKLKPQITVSITYCVFNSSKQVIWLNCVLSFAQVLFVLFISYLTQAVTIWKEAPWLREYFH